MLISMTLRSSAALEDNPLNMTIINALYYRERNKVINVTQSLLNFFFSDMENGID